MKTCGVLCVQYIFGEMPLAPERSLTKLALSDWVGTNASVTWSRHPVGCILRTMKEMSVANVGEENFDPVVTPTPTQRQLAPDRQS